MHGTTTHGVQVDDLTLRSRPTVYYARSSGVGLAAARLSDQLESGIGGRAEGLHFGIVGMGIGTMSAYSRAGDRVRYYEINPEVIEVAYGESQYFTFVKDSAAHVTIVSGDARLSLERELSGAVPQRFDLLVMDAFSSDSVPVHLVTEEAFRLYSAHLKTTTPFSPSTPQTGTSIWSRWLPRTLEHSVSMVSAWTALVINRWWQRLPGSC